jgi:hypothetical protein
MASESVARASLSSRSSARGLTGRGSGGPGGGIGAAEATATASEATAPEATAAGAEALAPHGALFGAIGAGSGCRDRSQEAPRSAPRAKTTKRYPVLTDRQPSLTYRRGKIVTSRDYDVTQLCAIEQFCSQVSAPLHVI